MVNVLRASALLLFGFFFANAALLPGQGSPNASSEATRATDSPWKRFTGKDEEFSVLMPDKPSLYLSSITDRPGKLTPERIYSSYSQGSAYLVVSYNGSSIKGTLENFKAHHLYQGAVSYARDLSVAGYSGKEYKLKFAEVGGTLQIYATKKHGYALATVQAIDDPPLSSYFLSSFLIKGEHENIVSAETQPPAPSQDIPTIDSSQSMLTGKDVTRRGVIVSKPEPWYTEEARQANITGTVVLRVVLSASGEVTNIHAVKGLPKGLTENAIEAARHLKFIPAVKDGRFVSYWVELQYNFGLY
jgi:TonB family protein